jgi:CheY-like chemotaxis protein
LASGVTHDFGNLLTLISGYTEMLLNRVSPEDPLRPELEEIRGAAQRGASMTTRLLNFIRSGAVELQSLDLNTLITDLERMLRPIIGEHVELAASLEEGLGRVRADRAQMTRVVMNLVLNARDAMPQGGRVTIRSANVELDPAEASARELAPGPYVSLAFSDTGSGMDAETMSHLFEPFFTTKASGKGTGLGLSTVYSILKECRGGVSVASAPGWGTTFTIYLPRIDDAREAPESDAAAHTPARGAETILVAEDEEAVRRLVKYVLNARGYTVLEARDGVDALDVFRQYPKPIHLLLTDMVMPRMGGSELVQVIRQLKPNMKVLCVSGYTDEALRCTGTTAQGFAFLQKPLRPEVLASKIREVLDQPATPPVAK